MSFKRIAVAIDGSETSELALIEALQLAKPLQAKLCIIHVADIPRYSFDLGIDFNKYLELVRADSQLILDRAKELAQTHDVKAETLLVENANEPKRISERITEAVQSWKAELLVIGTHGRRGFRRFILGSVAEDVIRITSFPVLLIRVKDET